MPVDSTSPPTLVNGARMPVMSMTAPPPRFGSRAADNAFTAVSFLSPITAFVYEWDGKPALPMHIAGMTAGAAGGTAAAYHGYKRHRGSRLAAVLWFPLGAWFWPITIPVAFAQGFAKPKAKKNRRTSKRRRTSRS